MKQAGFDSVTVDTYGNIIGCIKGNRPGPKLLFDGHIDTVPVSDEKEWKYPPFAAEIHDGKIYGRGTSDMKGAVSAFVSAAENFAQDTNRDFAGEIYVAGVVHEECFEGVAARAISAAVKPDYVVIAEASNLNLKVGQRGRGEIVVETFGVPCHSANPEKGINAVYKMAKVIEAIRTLVPTHHDVLGDGILELTDIKSAPYPGASVVPEYCRATYGAFPRILGKYVREDKALTLEEAVYKMTKKPATTFHITDRGELREGAYADICIFNPDTVIDKGTFTDPIQYPEGIEYVIINGETIVKNAEHTGKRSGCVLRQKNKEVVK